MLAPLDIIETEKIKTNEEKKASKEVRKKNFNWKK